jgi:hypothetical protein
VAYYCDIEDELAVITSSFESTGISSVLTNTALITDQATQVQASTSYEVAVITDSSTAPYLNYATDVAVVTGVASASLLCENISEAVYVTGDSSTWVASGRVDETAVITSDFATFFVATVAEDVAIITDSSTEVRYVDNTTTETAVLDDRLYAFLPSDLTDTAVITSAFSSDVISDSITDTAVITSTVPYVLRVADDTTDSALLNDTMFDRLLAENVTTDQAWISGVSIIEGAHNAWVCHVKQLGMSRFEDLNSHYMVRVGTRVLGLGLDDVYDMNNGAPVDAFVLTGANGKDASHVKRIPDVYVSGEAQGGMAITAYCDDDGQPVEYEYPFELRANVSTRNNRVKLGKGLRSRYWQFKFHNTGGDHFTLRTAAADTAVSTRRL